jgi:hypothetical protein
MKNAALIAGITNALARTAYSGGARAVRSARRWGRSARRTRERTDTMTRTTTPTSIALVAGEAAGSVDVSLGLVQTTDIIGMYDRYRINWVEIEIIPLYDPAQSGVTNNSEAFVAFANDPSGQLISPTWAQVASFANCKTACLVAGKSLKYRFRPKAINALAAGNYAINQNDWLLLNASGSGVAHYRLLMNIKTTLATNTNAYEYVLRINFSCAGSS